MQPGGYPKGRREVRTTLRIETKPLWGELKFFFLRHTAGGLPMEGSALGLSEAGKRTPWA